MNAVTDLLHETITSPWAYLIIWAIAAIDGFFPAVPSETLVITAGVFAANGEINIVVVIAVAALGAFVGDHVSYFIGRRSKNVVEKAMSKGRRRRASFEWAGRALNDRGGSILIVARYIPGGRTAITLTMGAVGFPLRSFTIFDAVASVAWGLYAGLLGYIGGKAFEDEPIKGLLAGFTLAFVIVIIIEVIRRFRHTSPEAQTSENTSENQKVASGR